LPCVSGSGLAAVALRPDQVRTSATPDFTNPATLTTFILHAPVQLMPGSEYSIVIRSDSDLYTVYTAELGSTIIGSDAKVAKQPYAGSFFKSQNASTWTESPFEDLMFRINRALWTGSVLVPQTGIMIARGIAPDANTTFDSFEFYPHEVQFAELTSTDYNLDIKPLNQGTGDLTGEIAVRYNVLPNEWSLLSAGRSMPQGYGGRNAANMITGRQLPAFGSSAIPASNTIDALCTLTTFSPDVAPFIDLKKINMLAVQHLINDMSLDSDDVVIVNPGTRYLPTWHSDNIMTVAGSAVVTSLAAQQFNLLQPGDLIDIVNPTGPVDFSVVVGSVTNNSSFIAAANVSTTSSGGSYVTYGSHNANTSRVTMTVTGGNGSGAAGYAIIGTTGQITGVVFTSPGSGYTGTPILTVPAPVPYPFGTGFEEWIGVLSLPQTQGVLGFNSELAMSGGNGLTRYIIRPVTLADGFDARDLTVTFDGYRPLGSDFLVYYKVLAGDADTLRFDDQVWRPMVMTTPDATISTGYFQYKEFSFATPHKRALDATTDTTDTFKVFAIKVVVASSDTVDVPRIANFRAIALDT
jgi:hypothetical protein